MRKIIIVMLIVLAMLFVSCSPESRKEDAKKEPTAEEFLTSFAAWVIPSDCTEKWLVSSDLGEGGKLNTTVVTADYLNEKIFEADGDALKRLYVTEILSADGTVKKDSTDSVHEANGVVIKFKYYVDTRTAIGSDWPETHTGDEKEGYLAFSYKGSQSMDTAKGVMTVEISNLSLNFNPMTVEDVPSVDSSKVTAFKNISFQRNTSGYVGASVDGVQLSQEEFNKVLDTFRQ